MRSAVIGDVSTAEVPMQPVSDSCPPFASEEFSKEFWLERRSASEERSDSSRNSCFFLHERHRGAHS